MDYNSTFADRCISYLHAVSAHPGVLLDEFRTAVEELDLQPTDIVLNIPASCASLLPYYTVQPRRTYEYETNTEFAALTGTETCTFNKIPLADQSVTKIVSLASLHHLTTEERSSFYRECQRILQPGGELIIGDVQRGSAQETWLDNFVDKKNSNGHKGVFFGEEDCVQLQREGYQTRTSLRQYHWTFLSDQAMTEFCRALFGLDIATDTEILTMAKTYLGYDSQTTRFQWQLLYIHALKP